MESKCFLCKRKPISYIKQTLISNDYFKPVCIECELSVCLQTNLIWKKETDTLIKFIMAKDGV